MSGVYHPAGCRCPGCVPGQYVMRARQAASRPAQYRAPAARPRAERAVKKEDPGIIGPGLLIIGIGFVTFCWPALVWHGYTDTGGWRWDIHSTIACLVYWGILAMVILLYWQDHRTPKGKAAAAKPPPQPVVAAPPLCTHRKVTPVNNILTGQLEAWLCLNPACGIQLDPGVRSAELTPDASWPPVRRHR